MIRIVIADDHRLFRETLGEMLRSRNTVEIVAMCTNSDEVLDVLESGDPDLIFLDMKMKPLPGIAVTKKIRQSSSVKIIGLSMYSLPAYATNMFSAGANGYITKNSSLDEIFIGIDTVLNGKKFLCREVRDLMVKDEMEPENRLPHIGMLTDREIEVAQLICKGLGSREIAVTLNCTYNTIEVHRHHMLKKLQLKNASEMVNFLYSQLPDLI